jgi:hypothetical protein
MEWLRALDGAVGVDEASGAIVALRLDAPELDLVAHQDPRGLLRVAAPLLDLGAHYLQTGQHGAPQLDRRGDTLTFRYGDLQSAEARLPIEIEINFTPLSDGLTLRARVHNRWSEAIPQVVFPQIFGLGPVGDSGATRVQLGRGKLKPFRDLAMRPDSAMYLERDLYRYYAYGYPSHFNMKWLDYGSPAGGCTLYARDSRYVTQGLLVERPDRAEERAELRWIHYPSIAPGQTWESPEFVLLLHAGDWYAGANAYRAWASAHYPYRAPQRLRAALGIRSIWLSYLHTRPMYRFIDLPELATELQDLDLAELCIWGWTAHFGYPMRINPLVGTRNELMAGIRACQDAGVPVCLFTSHHLVADGPESDPAWFHLDAAGQRQLSNWTYNREFLPRFGPPIVATHSAVMASALAHGWREAGLDEYRKLIEMGANSICFDQFFAWDDPNYNPSRDGRPDEEGEKLLEFGGQARAIIHAHDPAGTFSGEGVVDASVPVIDYTWEWHDSYRFAEYGPFRYVFPHYRLNANVNEHPRGALLGFVEGALLNVMPKAMEGRLRDYPGLVTTLKHLARLRRRFLPYFTDGLFHFDKGLEVQGCVARRYSHCHRTLVLATNPSDDAVEATIVIEPVGDQLEAPSRLHIYDLAGDELETRDLAPAPVRYRAILPADGLRVLEILPVGNVSQ